MTFRMFAQSNDLPYSDYEDSLYDKLADSFFIEKLSFASKLISTNKQKDKIPIPFTYLGQMISHELIRTPSSNRANIDGALTLSSLYDNPINEELFDDNGEFLLGHNNSDIKRYQNGRAIIPEPRNDENLIISQFHLFWQKVHNKLAKNPDLNQYKKAEKIKVTKKQVVYLFHKIVIEDYLVRLLHPRTYDIYFTQKKQFFLKFQSANKVPVEFSHACFRFGHSMVRDSYQLNKQSKFLKLGELLMHNVSLPLNNDEIVDWRFLITQASSSIDTEIASSMQRIPPLLGGSGCMSNTNILRANLKKGIEAKLAFPIDVIEYIRALPDDIAETLGLDEMQYNLPSGNRHIAGVSERSFPNGKWPMWLYILIEAQNEFGGKILGQFGSTVVAEVLSYSIRKVSNNPLVGNIKIVEELLPQGLQNKEHFELEQLIAWL